MAALELGPTSRLVTIASGGCNVMSYLTADPMRRPGGRPQPGARGAAQAQARRRPPSAALRGVPRLLRRGRHRQQSAPLRALRGPAPRRRRCATSGTSRDLAGRRRIAHVQPQPLQPRPARPHHPARPRGLPAARQAARSACSTRAAWPSSAACSRTSWRRCSTAGSCASWPTCRRPISAWASRRPSSTRSRPTPAATSPRCCARGSSASPAISRSRRTGSPGRPSAGRYPGQGRGAAALPAAGELRAGLRERVTRVEIEQITFTDFLRRQDARTVDAYVLLDAQDWMSRAQIAALWAADQPHRPARAPG